MSLSSILDKVRHLRELSKSSNIHEATTAAAMADRLISKHRISEAELSMATKAADLPAQEDSVFLYETAKVTPWKRSLVQVLSNHYGCAVFNDIIHKPNSKTNGFRKVTRYRLVGILSDMEITRYMFAWLSEEIERLSKSHCAGQGHVYSQSYCQGAVAGIKTQLDIVKREQKNSAIESGQTTALACLDERYNNASRTMYALHSNMTTVKSNSHSHFDSNAYNLGVAIGKSIDLGLSSSSSNFLK